MKSKSKIVIIFTCPFEGFGLYHIYIYLDYGSRHVPRRNIQASVAGLFWPWEQKGSTHYGLSWMGGIFIYIWMGGILNFRMCVNINIQYIYIIIYIYIMYNSLYLFMSIYSICQFVHTYVCSRVAYITICYDTVYLVTLVWSHSIAIVYSSASIWVTVLPPLISKKQGFEEPASPPPSWVLSGWWDIQ